MFILVGERVTFLGVVPAWSPPARDSMIPGHGSSCADSKLEHFKQESMEKMEVMDSDTLWLCQNSYWKWPFIVDFPIKNGDFP